MRFLKSNSGSVFLVVTFVFSIVFVVVTLLMAVSASELSITRSSTERNRAYYMALSGIEIGAANIEAGLDMEADFAGGSGTIYDPYLIATAAQFENVGGGDFFYRQIADIDLTGSSIAGIQNIALYDGNGYVLKNLTIEGSGLFVNLQYYNEGKPGIIKNLGLINVNIDGDDNSNVGALVGEVFGFEEGGMIKNCYVRGGTIKGAGENLGGLVGKVTNGRIINSYVIADVIGENENVGGLVGKNRGNIKNSYFAGTVRSNFAEGDSNAGGLVGLNEGGKIKDCYTGGYIFAKGSNVGGLVGLSSGTSSAIEGSYSRVDVEVEGEEPEMPSAIGGLVGLSDAEIKESFASGRVVAIGNKVGGLVGHNRVGADIENCYAEGMVVAGGRNDTLGEKVGGLVGENEGSISKTYAVGMVEGKEDSDVGGLVGFSSEVVDDSFYLDPPHNDYDSDIGTPSSREELEDSDTFSTWDMSGTWLINDGNSYPYFNFAGGDGSEDDPFKVSTPMHLHNVRNNLGAYYKQIEDISLAIFLHGKYWTPIGQKEDLLSYGIPSPFEGGYDGNGKKIIDLKIDDGSSEGIDFDIGDMDDLEIWLDASKEDSIVRHSGGGNDDKVAKWKDRREGSEKSVESSISGLAPTTTTVGGIESVKFRGHPPSALALIRDVADGAIGITGPGIGLNRKISVFMVANSNYEESQSPQWRNSPSESEGYNSFAFRLQDAGGVLEFLLGDDASSDRVIGYDEFGFDISRRNIYFIGSAESDEFNYYGVSGELGISLRNIERAKSTTAVALSVGGDIRDVASFDGNIQEYIIFNRELTQDERLKVELYLNRKWNVNPNPGGLFGYVNNANLENIRIEGVDVSWLNEVGALAGIATGSSRVKNCYSSGVVQGASDVGGLIGVLKDGGEIKYSYTQINVKGIGGSNGLNVGGLVGRNDGSIEKSQAYGSAISNSGYVGGLVGRNDDGGIKISHADVKVSGGAIGLGGLVGKNQYEIKNCYATGDVVAGTGSKGGGLVGENRASGTIQKSYAIGLVTGAEGDVGGLVGRNFNVTEEDISASFYDSQTTGQSDSDGGIEKNTAEMKMKYTFEDWAFDDVWVIEEHITYPHFEFDGGDGTKQNPYRVRTAPQLNNVRNYASKHFVQVGDINLRGYGRGYNDEKGWEPITTGGIFTGSFDGDIYRISNLYIDRPEEDYVSFFGKVSSSGIGIKNITLVNVQINGRSHVGALAGKIEGGATLSAISASGSVRGNGDNVGGFAGYIGKDVTVEKSSSTVHVRNDGANSNNTGGFVGQNKGTIKICYASGEVLSENERVGGLVGFNEDGEIQNCYATGEVRGRDRVGGLVGRNTGDIEKCYAVGWVNEGNTIGGADVGGLVGENSGGEVDSYYDSDTVGFQAGAGSAQRSWDMKDVGQMTGGGIYKNWETIEHHEDGFPIWMMEGSAQKTGIDPIINDGYPYFVVHRSFEILSMGAFSAEDLKFGYERNHHLSVGVTYNSSAEVYEIVSTAIYRRSEVTITRYARIEGSVGGGDRRVVVVAGTRR